MNKDEMKLFDQLYAVAFGHLLKIYEIDDSDEVWKRGIHQYAYEMALQMIYYKQDMQDVESK